MLEKLLKIFPSDTILEFGAHHCYSTTILATSPVAVVEGEYSTAATSETVSTANPVRVARTMPACTARIPQHNP